MLGLSNVCTEQIFDSRLFMHNKIFFGKTVLEVCIPHLYASFGTFCAQIVQYFGHFILIESVAQDFIHMTYSRNTEGLFKET